MVRKLVMTAGVAALVAIAISAASFASASDEGGGRTIVFIEIRRPRSSLTSASRGPRLVTSSSSPARSGTPRRRTGSAPTTAIAWLKRRR